MSRLKLCPVQKKLCYPSKYQAFRSALRSSRRSGRPLRVYFHRECKSFHITKKTKAEFMAGVDTNNKREKASA